MFTVSAGGGEFKQFSLEYRSTLPLLPTVQVKEYMSQRIGFTSSLSPFTIHHTISEFICDHQVH